MASRARGELKVSRGHNEGALKNLVGNRKVWPKTTSPRGNALPGQIVKMPGFLRRSRVDLEFTLRPPGYFADSSILPQILPQTSSQTQGNSRVSRMEHQTPSVFPGNFRKRKVLGTLCFPFCLPDNLVQAKVTCETS